MFESVDDFLAACSGCGQCRSVCPFLEEHGTPEEIVGERPHLAFLCTNCTGCDTRCPLDLSPSAALFATKERLLGEGRLPPAAAAARSSAEAFARRGAAPPFLRYDRTSTAFWPGCSLAGTSPRTVRRTAALLARALGEEVGIVLDCCFDPVYQMGDARGTGEAMVAVRERLDRAGVRRLVVGCLNCRKVFARYLPDRGVVHVLEALPTGSIEALPQGDYYLHHPCPAYRVAGATERARAELASVLGEVDEQRAPACCGLGGGLRDQDPRLADRFAERVTMASYGATVVTSCMGCKNTFLKRGRETVHLLELLSGTKPGRAPVGSVRRWANRLMLAKGAVR